MEMIPVRSTAISAVGYDAASRRMSIRFRNGGTYTFCNVPENIFNGLLDARSIGRYYDDNIRDRYQC